VTNKKFENFWKALAIDAKGEKQFSREAVFKEVEKDSRSRNYLFERGVLKISVCT
jgi:hypothetical protein